MKAGTRPTAVDGLDLHPGPFRHRGETVHTGLWFKRDVLYEPSVITDGWRINGTHYYIATLDGQRWWLIVATTTAEDAYPDIGPFESLEAAHVAATLLDES